MMVAAGAARAWTPGGDYPTGDSGLPAATFDPLSGLVPYSMNIQVVGRISTNDVAVFTDRTGRYLRGTNLVSLLDGLAPAAINAGMSNYLAQVNAAATNAAAQAQASAALAALATNDAARAMAGLGTQSNLTAAAQAAATNAAAQAAAAYAAGTNAAALAAAAYAAGTNAIAEASSVEYLAAAGYAAGTNALALAQAAGTNTSAAAAQAAQAYAAATNAQAEASAAAFSAALAAADLEYAFSAATNAQDYAYIAMTNAADAAAQTGALTNETDDIALAALAAHAAYWPSSATASSWFTFTTNNNEITITGYNIGGGTDVVIPDYINGWPVTAIGEFSFSPDYWGMAITSVVAPRVTTIGRGAFFSCSALTSDSWPQATTIGVDAFNGC